MRKTGTYWQEKHVIQTGSGTTLRARDSCQRDTWWTGTSWQDLRYRLGLKWPLRAVCRVRKPRCILTPTDNRNGTYRWGVELPQRAMRHIRIEKATLYTNSNTSWQQEWDIQTGLDWPLRVMHHRKPCYILTRTDNRNGIWNCPKGPVIRKYIALTRTFTDLVLVFSNSDFYFLENFG